MMTSIFLVRMLKNGSPFILGSRAKGGARIPFGFSGEGVISIWMDGEVIEGG